MRTIRSWCAIAEATCCLVSGYMATAVGAVEPDAAPLRRVQTIPLAGPVGRLDHLARDLVRQGRVVANMANSSLGYARRGWMGVGGQGKLIRQVPGHRRSLGSRAAPALAG